ncbi:MAG TPA: patatin-like phospholipase family protein [Beijerinckiaceae bacterium]|nr:patatin-like phospholipase family protein [Beijerinckiaceae bacterium]
MGSIPDDNATTFNHVDPGTKLALCLSGGGLRATFFHFGVVKALAGADRLKDVSDIIAVSGGSILAGHMIKNWDSYCGTAQNLDAMEMELRRMAARGMRERVVRRWVTKGAWHGLKALLGSEHRPYTQSRAIQYEYERVLGKGTVADCYRNAPREKRPPQVHFMCTNFNSGEPCCFTSDEFIIYRKPPISVVNGVAKRPAGAGHTGTGSDKDEPVRKLTMAVSSDTVELSYAVAASSAFPGLFPPMKLNAARLGASARDFPVTVYLSDGGIYDNLGLEHFKELVRQSEKKASSETSSQVRAKPDDERMLKASTGGTHAQAVLVSNASGAFQWDNRNDFYHLLPRNLRTIDILMNLMIEERWETTPKELVQGEKARKIHLLRADIGNAHWEAGAPPKSVQQQIQDIRTDLDRFTDEEITLLIDHGYRTARQQTGVEPVQQSSPFMAAAAGEPAPVGRFRLLDDLVKTAAERQPRLFDWHDPLRSLGMGIALLVLFVAAILPFVAPFAAWGWWDANEKLFDSRKENDAKSDRIAAQAQELQSIKKALEDITNAQIASATRLEQLSGSSGAKAPPPDSSTPADLPVLRPDPTRPSRDVLLSQREKLDELQKQIQFTIKQEVARIETLSAQRDFKPQSTRVEVNRQSYKVWLQFAGSFRRQEMIDFGKALKAKWPNAPGAEQGGERTENAAGLFEVRYGPPEDKAAAEALTQDILDLKIVPKMNQPRRLAIIPKGSLEIWISK